MSMLVMKLRKKLDAEIARRIEAENALLEEKLKHDPLYVAVSRMPQCALALYFLCMRVIYRIEKHTDIDDRACLVAIDRWCDLIDADNDDDDDEFRFDEKDTQLPDRLIAIANHSSIQNDEWIDHVYREIDVRHTLGIWWMRGPFHLAVKNLRQHARIASGLLTSRMIEDSKDFLRILANVF